jgi:hypothetical protein
MVETVPMGLRRKGTSHLRGRKSGSRGLRRKRPSRKKTDPKESLRKLG